MLINQESKNCNFTVELYTLEGYFDLISSVDEFVIYDDMQYTRRDWRNHNILRHQMVKIG